ncbi:MAG: DUF2163 domain-containing protein [Caulobacterales bacterium]|nr:DUF2163 domain-containing protein [Caulobacterales bacterium]
MRTIPTELQARLDSGVTTLAWCWRVERADGVVLGFTDHDRPLSFDGVSYVAASAAMTGAAQSELGFAPDAAGFAGVLDSATLAESELADGRFDEAMIDLYRVDWTEVSLRVLVWRGAFGEVRRGETGFEAEARGLAAGLERTIGRVYQRRCDAVLGDARCTVDLQQASFRADGAVIELIDARRFRASGLTSFGEGFFTRGFVSWSSGANAGSNTEIDVQRPSGGETVIELLAAPGAPVAEADAFTAVAGCDKRWSTCRDKFGNIANFRGFPMMPGNDWVQGGARSGDVNDGGSLWTDQGA